jgi:hypothetical protein
MVNFLGISKRKPDMNQLLFTEFRKESTSNIGQEMAISFASRLEGMGIVWSNLKLLLQTVVRQ